MFAEAVARQIRHQLPGADPREHEDAHGAFTDEELAEARERVLGTADGARGVDAA